MRGRLARAAGGMLVAVAVVAATPRAADRQSDLDALMEDVLAHRDENWRKLRQYILDEREQVEILGTGGVRLWGERRDYTWYVRDGFFVRSPRTVNGVAVPDAERLAYEEEFLARAREREQDAREAGASTPPAEGPAAGEPGTAGMEGILRQTRRPAFIDSAYFLRFKFEPGRYAFVGRESLDGRETLRVEYYPQRLFDHEQEDQDRRRRERRGDRDEDVEAETERLMNEASLVTLWIEPDARQIVRYTFDNVDLDFLPGAWLVRADDIRATMTMSEPFPGIWLPRHVDMFVRVMLAVGPIDIRYGLDYDDYRQATTGGRLLAPEGGAR